MATKNTHKEMVLEHLARLPTASDRIHFLTRRGLLTPSTVKRLDEAVGRLVRIDLHQAHRLATAAVTVANRLDDAQSRAYAARAKANALWFLGQNEKASRLHSRAAQLFEQVGNAIEAGRTLSSSIQPLILSGEYKRALHAAKRAARIFSTAGDAKRLARLDINVGNILHRQDRFREALDCYERAFARLQPAKDTEGIIAALHNAAVCQIALNEYEQALRTYKLVRKSGQKGRMPLAVAQADYNIAYLYYLRGRYGQAVEMLRAAQKFSENVGDAYHAALCRLDLSEIYLELNLNQDAGELAKEAFASFQRLGMGYEAGKALCNSAIGLAQQGHAPRALDLFAQARNMFVREKNRVWPFLIDLYQAMAYFGEDRLSEARRCCVSALQFFSSSPLLNRTVLCRLLLAKLSLRGRDVDAAREQCRFAFRDLNRREMPILAYQAQLVMGQIEELTHNLSRARRHYHRAKHILDRLRGGVHGEELKISFMSNRVEVYEKLVRVCLSQEPRPKAQEEAWTYIEQAKSRNLLEMIARQAKSAAVVGHSTQPLIALREELNWYYHRIEAEQLGQAPPMNKRLRALRKLAEERERSFLMALREIDPDDTEAPAVRVSGSVPLETLREILGQNTALVEYSRVEDRILASVVTEDDLQITQVTNTTRIAGTIRLLQFQLSKYRLDPIYLQKFQVPLLEATQAHLFELYQELIAPIRQQLKRHHLVVVPHESLHCVPFHACYDGAQYLVDDFTVSYAPSASIYVQCCKRKSKRCDRALVLGVPDPKAPSIREEVRSVAKTLPRAEVFLGSTASAEVLRKRGPRSGLIHIATHGFFRQDRPIFSGIRVGDAFLTLYDLYQLRLPVEHITLSGCSTGANVVAAGDELIGLMRGLLSAGARSLLLTLWDVNDSSTAAFMKLFYRLLVNGSDRAQALRHAMREMRKHYPHPYYWAPFVLVGNVFS